jgi:hypothetical protein
MLATTEKANINYLKNRRQMTTLLKIETASMEPQADTIFSNLYLVLPIIVLTNFLP